MSPLHLLLSFLLSGLTYFADKEKAVTETEVVVSEQFLCLPPFLPSDLLASLCSCFMAGKIESEQS